MDESTPKVAQSTVELLMSLQESRHSLADRLEILQKALDVAAARQEIRALDLVSKIRWALGDTGRRMQDELIKYCEEMVRQATRYKLLLAIAAELRSELMAYQQQWGCGTLAESPALAHYRDFRNSEGDK